METIIVTADETVEQICGVLQSAFPDTVFAVRLEEPVIEREEICGVDVIWVDGPARDLVEDLLDPFQGVNWDPRTGELGGRVHMAINEAGELIRIVHNIDYIFCDGPTEALFQS